MKYLAYICVLVFAAGCIQPEYRNIYQKTPEKIPGEIQDEDGFDYFKLGVPDANIEHPLIVEFPVVKSPMPYYIISDPDVNKQKYNTTLENLRTALGMWENATKGKVKFVRVEEMPKEGIVINITAKNYYTYDIPLGASREEIAGEASPLYYNLDNYSLIVGGIITIGPLYGAQENRVQIVHEMGHIMGLGHSNNTHSVLYPRVAYSQEITPEIISAMDILYSAVPEIK